MISVSVDSPAERAGIPLGAVITAVDDTPVRTPQELTAVIRSAVQPNVKLTYVYGGLTQQASAELDMPTPDAGPLLETRQATATVAP